MNSIISLIVLFASLNASSYKYSDINMQVDFFLTSKNQKSKTLTYTSNFAIYYDENKKFKEKIYCFNDNEYIFVTKNSKKPKYKICIDQNNSSKIYVMDKNHRYQKIDEIDVNVQNIILKIEDKDSKRICTAKALKYDGITSKINQCLKEI